MEEKELSKYEQYSRMMKREFSQIQDYLREVNNSFIEKLGKLNIQVKEAPSEEMPAFAWNFYVGQIRYDGFKVIFHHSTFISCYSVFEIKLKELCDIVAMQKKCKFKIGDMGGNDIIKNCKKYLEKIADVDFSPLEKEWVQIVHYQKTRNIIAHGLKLYVEKNTDSGLLKFWESNQFITNDGDAFYISSERFVVEFTELAALYLSSIAAVIDTEKSTS